VRYPAFLAEMGLPQHRERLVFSYRSGFTLVTAFGLLVIVGVVSGAVPFSWVYFAPVLLKLFFNTLAWQGLKRNFLALETAGINVCVDVVAMTWAIYLTGGVMSPLLGIYGIELTVVALLSNVGITVLVMGLALACYGAMLALVHFGYIEAITPPLTSHGQVTSGYLFVAILVAVLIVGVPTFFTAGILRRLREKNDALEAKTAELIEAGRQKSQFMANVTHELRTPIHGICGLSEVMESGIYGELSDKQRFAQGEIRRSARSLLQLVDDLLELARTDAGALTLSITAVDVGEVVRQVFASGRAVLGTKDLELVCDIPADLPRMRTDRAKLTHILLNLFVNAIKFTPEGGKVTISVSPGTEWLEISVTDTGVGISDAELPLVFEPFRQADGSTEREHGGVGLGLAIVMRLTEALSAKIRVKSAVGKGSTFSVDLPMKRPEDVRLRAPRA